MEEEKKDDDLKEFIGTARAGRRNALTEGESEKDDPTSEEIAKKLESLAIEEKKAAEEGKS